MTAEVAPSGSGSPEAAARERRRFGASDDARILYYEDIDEGAEQPGHSCVVDETEMLDYARRYDFWPFHLDAEASRDSIYGELIASGGYTLSLWLQLGHQLRDGNRTVWAMLGGLEFRVRFVGAVKAGDRLTLQRRVAGKRPTSKPDRGIIFAESKLADDNGTVVFAVEETFLVARRP